MVLCRSNNYQDWPKMSGNMLVYLIIQNLRFDYIHSSIFKILFNGRVSLWATPPILFKTL